MTDPRLKLLARLATAEPGRARVDRTRARCHARLERNHPGRRGAKRAHIVLPWGPLAMGLSGVYLSEAVRQVLAAYGIVGL
jgi:hypothetical protein